MSFLLPARVDTETLIFPQVADDEISDNSAECVVCLSDVRDTLILPCRHLCLCNACADTLRYQANCCPICRLREFPTSREPGAQPTGRFRPSLLTSGFKFPRSF